MCVFGVRVGGVLHTYVYVYTRQARARTYVRTERSVYCKSERKIGEKSILNHIDVKPKFFVVSNE